MREMTLAEVVATLRKLEKRWPKGKYEIFIGDGALSLYRSPLLMKESGAVDANAAVADFPGIPADGGGYW